MTSQPHRTLPKGKLGERFAASFLIRRGYHIIARNFRARFGEIDLIATYQGTLIFIEVKTRWGTAYGTPEEAVTHWKLKHLTATAEYFKLLHPELPDRLSIDVVAVDLSTRVPRINHLKNVTG